MAKLQDIIQQNKNNKPVRRGPGGLLLEDTPEELNSLAQQAGLQAPPITPGGATSLGASPDSAKMAGTPAQKKSALNMATAPSQNLADVQRRAQARTAITGTEEQQQQRAEQLKQLGSVGQRAEQFIEKQRQALQQQAQQQTQANVLINDNASLISQIQDPAKLDQFKSLLQQYQQDPQNMQLLVDAGNLIGGKAISPQEISNLYMAADKNTAQSAAGVVQDKFSVNDLLSQPEFGYSQEELAQLLGVGPADLANYSVSDLEARVNQLAQDEYNRAQEASQQAGSTQLGAAERQLARQQGRDLSATGIRATEQDVRNLEDQIASGMQVQFGGTSYRIDDLLNDETISNVVLDYIQNPDSLEAKRLAQEEPELVALINKNKALFEEANSQMQAGTTEFGKIQEENKALANVGNVALDPKLMQVLAPGYDKLQASRLQIDPNSALNYIKNQSSNPESVATGLNQLAISNPEYSQELGELSGEEVRKLGIENNSPQWRNFQQAVKTADELAKIDPSDIDTVLDNYLGFAGGQEAAQNFLTENQARRALGLDTGKADLLDSDGDGRLDDSSIILQNMQARTPKPTLKQAAEGQVQAPTRTSLDQPALQGNQAKLFEKLGIAAQDGVIDAQEITQAFQNTAGSDLLDVINLSKKPPPGLDQGAKNSLTSILQKGKDTNSRSAIAAANKLDLTGKIKSLQGLLKGKDTYGGGLKNTEFVNTKMIQDEINKANKKLIEEAEAAARSNSEAAQKKKNDQIVLAAKLQFPGLATGDALVALGKLTGNDNLQKWGTGINKGVFNTTMALKDVGQKLLDANKKTEETIRNIGNKITGGRWG